MAGIETWKPVDLDTLINAPSNGIEHPPVPEKPNINFGLFMKSVMDQKKDYPLPTPLIKLINGSNETPLFTLKSFTLIHGKQKAKKTTLIAMMVAAIIMYSKSNDNIRFERAMEGVVLFFDCEQGESYAARTMKLILKLAGLDSSVKLIYCDLREYSPIDRFKIIEAGIQNTHNVRLVVIDGLVDLMTDFMDAAEGHMTITNIIKLCSKFDIHVVGILHQNKADKNARAHVGTISSQKCEMEISTEVDPQNRSQSIVNCVNSRGLPFEDFAIKWEKGSLPFIVQDFSSVINNDEKASAELEVWKAHVKRVLKPLEALREKDLVDGLIGVADKSESTVKRKIKVLVTDGILLHNVDEKLYRINVEKL